MLKRIRSLVTRLVNRYLGPLPDAAHESGTERDGAFSYAGEWHPFTWGLSLGLAIALSAGVNPALTRSLVGIAAALLVYAYTGRLARAKDKTDLPKYVYRQIHREPHYFGGGLVIGAIAGTVLAVVWNLQSGGAFPLPVPV